MFDPGSDLNAMQKMLIEDDAILQLMDLKGKSRLEKSQRIIKRSQWDGMATNEKRLCIYFIPDRPTRNQNFLQGIYEVDIHLPISQDFQAWQIQKRVKEIFHKKKVNCRYAYFEGQLGELPTMKGFFCCGSRFSFSRTI